MLFIIFLLICFVSKISMDIVLKFVYIRHLDFALLFIYIYIYIYTHTHTHLTSLATPLTEMFV
jgi:hypothetical protein